MKTISIKQYLSFSYVLTLVAVITLSACGGGGGDDDGGGVSDAQAKSAFISGVTRSLGASLGAGGDILADSAAVQTVLGSAGISTAMPPPVTRAMTRAPGDEDPMAVLEEQIETALNSLLSGGVRSGDSITYNPNENALCTDAILGGLPDLSGDTPETEQAIADCIEFYSHITIVLTINSSSSGTAAIKYDAFTMLLIGYAPDNAYFEISLAQWKSIIQALEVSDDSSLPATFEGVIRLAFAELGVDYGRVTLSIEEAINVVDTTDGAEASVSIAATPKVFEFTGNGPAGTASIEIGLAAMDALFPIDAEDNNSGSDQQAEIDLAGLTLRADLEAGGDELVFTNIGIGGLPFTFNVIDTSALFTENDPTDLSIALDTFGFTIDGLSETIIFDVALNFGLDINDAFGVFELDTPASSLEIDIAQNTELDPDQVGGEDVFQVNLGTVSGTGTGDFTGSAIYSTGQCFMIDDQGGFPLTDCPL